MDIIATNGFSEKTFVRDNMVLFQNEGYDKTMRDIALESGMLYDGMGRGLLVFDYDNDGDEDILVAGNVGEPKLFTNNGGNMKNWVKVKPMHV